MDAAEAWAAEHELQVQQWRVNRQFRAAEEWYAITWTEGAAGALGEWTVTPIEG
jgi:hypothetical protein